MKKYAFISYVLSCVAKEYPEYEEINTKNLLQAMHRTKVKYNELTDANETRRLLYRFLPNVPTTEIDKIISSCSKKWEKIDRICEDDLELIKAILRRHGYNLIRSKRAV